MSEREQGIQIDDEIEEELFCEKLAERYLSDPEHETISFKEAICDFCILAHAESFS